MTRRRGIYRAPEAGDIAFIAKHMREADRQEVFAAVGNVDLADALAKWVTHSSLCWTGITSEGEPVCFFGAAALSLLGGQGCPWMLGTDRVSSTPGTLVRDGRRYVRQMLGVFPHLVNYVDARNTTSVRWLRHLGFTVHEPAPYGVAGLPFHRFEMKA